MSDESAHKIGLDTEGNLLRLGEIDCDGEVVGYIDENRQVWISRTERDMAVGGGRCFDAFMAANLVGGLFGWPDYTRVMYEAGVKVENVGAAVAEMHRMIRVYAEGTRERAYYAAMN